MVLPNWTMYRTVSIGSGSVDACQSNVGNVVVTSLVFVGYVNANAAGASLAMFSKNEPGSDSALSHEPSLVDTVQKYCPLSGSVAVICQLVVSVPSVTAVAESSLVVKVPSL